MSRSRAIIVELTPRPLERVESEVAVAGFFRDERPLRGGAGRLDWRLCGDLSRRIQAGDLSGQRGEALLIGCGRALRSPRLLLLGLGDRSGFGGSRVSEAIHAAALRCRALRCRRVGLSPLGLAPDDLPRHAPALVSGLRGFERDEARDPDPLWLRLCVSSREIASVAQALIEACRSQRVEEEIEVRTPPTERDRA